MVKNCGDPDELQLIQKFDYVYVYTNVVLSPTTFPFDDSLLMKRKKNQLFVFIDCWVTLWFVPLQLYGFS